MGSFLSRVVGTLRNPGVTALEVWRGWPWIVRVAVVVALLLVAAINAIGMAQTTLWLVRHGAANGDWDNLARLTVSDPYSVAAFRWSPPAAWLWATLVVPIGLVAWQLLHLVALALMRDWRVVLLGLVSWPFWQDLANGNLMILVVLCAWWALRGNRVAAIGFVALSVLVPRPLMLPVLGWLLVRRPETRIWFAVIAVAVVGTSALAGQLDSWIDRTLVTAPQEMSVIWNIGPSRILGSAWIPIGAVLAALFAWRGWLGTASVMISPYLFPYYLLMLLLDVPRALDRRARPPA